MNHAQFDELTIAAATGTRRSLWRALAGLTVGGALGLGGGATPADAARASCKGSYSREEVKRYIRRAARQYRVPYREMLCVARCESNLYPCARNPSGPYYGLFQFLKSTFERTSYGDRNMYNPRWNALAAAELWSQTPRRNLGNVWTCYDIDNCGRR